MKQCLPLALLPVSCGSGKSYTVGVQNLSAKSFDSVHVLVNASTDNVPAIKNSSLLPGEATAPLSVGEIISWSNNRTTKLSTIFYAADTVIKSTMPNNGEKGANAHYKAAIDSGLQVNWSNVTKWGGNLKLIF